MAAERDDAINAAIDHAAGYVAYRSSRVGAFLGMLKEHGFTVAALAAQPSAEPGLDVERLAMAMAETFDDGDEMGWRLVRMSDDGGVVPTALPRAFVEAIAVAYAAALTPDRPTPA